MSISEMLAEKREEILQTAAAYGAHNVRVFGSVARGEADEKSDVDLLVHFDANMSLLKHAALKRTLEALLGVRVDVVSDRGLRDRVRERVLEEAVAL